MQRRHSSHTNNVNSSLLKFKYMSVSEELPLAEPHFTAMYSIVHCRFKDMFLSVLRAIKACAFQYTLIQQQCLFLLTISHIRRVVQVDFRDVPIERHKFVLDVFYLQNVICEWPAHLKNCNTGVFGKSDKIDTLKALTAKCGWLP